MSSPTIYHENRKSFHSVCHGVYGRKKIVSKYDYVDMSNIREVLDDALSIHNQNRREIDYLYHYVSGDQPINYREKKIRPEINNKTLENHALEIVRFMMAQSFGEPVQYATVDNDKHKSDAIEALNKYMTNCSKDADDIELGDWQSTCGTGYREVWSVPIDKLEDGEPPFDTCTLDPRKTFIVYSSAKGNPPLMSVCIKTDVKGKRYYQCDNGNFVFTVPESDSNKISVVQNGHGRILIIEFPNNNRLLSDVEIVITLLDAMNNVQSNRMDGIEQFIQSFIKFVNCDIDDDEFLKMCKIGALKVKTANPAFPASVDSTSQQLDQAQTQTVQDDLYKKMLIIEGMPGREQNTGGDTGQAVYLRNGWDFAEQRAKIDEPIFKRSEREFLKTVLNILKNKRGYADIFNGVTIADIDIKITRNKTDNMLVKAQALDYLLRNGIHPKIAIKTCDMWSDSEKVYVLSKEYLDGIYKTAEQLQKEAEMQGGDNLA